MGLCSHPSLCGPSFGVIACIIGRSCWRRAFRSESILYNRSSSGTAEESECFAGVSNDAARRSGAPPTAWTDLGSEDSARCASAVVQLEARSVKCVDGARFSGSGASAPLSDLAESLPVDLVVWTLRELSDPRVLPRAARRASFSACSRRFSASSRNRDSVIHDSSRSSKPAVHGLPSTLRIVLSAPCEINTSTSAL